MNVLVTGACSLSGREVVVQLQNRHEITLLSIERAQRTFGYTPAYRMGA